MNLKQEKSGAKTLNHITSEGNSFLENNRWLNAKEAAQYLRLASVGVLRNMVSQRRVPFYKLGRSLRFKRSDLDQLIESSKRIGGFYEY